LQKTLDAKTLAWFCFSVESILIYLATTKSLDCTRTN